MFILIVFTDGTYYICNTKDVIQKNDMYVAKYKGRRYACRILARHSK